MNEQRNWRGKEYNWNCNLIFEGEYKKGERNGKGKEYDCINGKLKYECEYLNGKKNGKGKEYLDNGQLKFEGEYINDKEWIGTGYNKNGNIIYKLIIIIMEKEGNIMKMVN